MINKKIKNNLEHIFRENLVGAKINFPYIYVHHPQSREEALNLFYQWKAMFENEEIRKSITEITWVYQEKDKELPLSSFGNLAKKIGFNVKPKIEEGKIGEASVIPKLIRHSENQKYLELITTEDQWIPINKISQNCNTFFAPYVMLPANLCYNVKIPFECIVQVKFNEETK